MLFEFNSYSSILLIFFSQGAVFSLLLLRKGIKQEDKSNIWLSLLLFLCCLYIIPWLLGYAGWYNQQPYRDILFYIPFQQLFLIGPIIFFYTQSLLNPAFQLSPRDWLHFLPAISYLIYSFFISLADQVIFQEHYFYADGRDKDLDTWYQVIGLLSMSIYFYLSLRYYNLYRKLVLQVLSFADDVLYSWIKKYLLVFLLMQVCRAVFYVLYPHWDDFPGLWWYYLIFSFLFYYLAITAYANPIRSFVPFRLYLFSRDPIHLLEGTPTSLQGNGDKMSEQVISPDPITVVEKETDSLDIETWKAKILELIVDQKLCYNPNLTLTELARRLNTNSTVISRVINKGFQVNFNDFVNHYRVEAVKTQLQNGKHRKKTLLGIALDCGFNSKTTFNRAFKKNMRLSPKEYLLKMGNDSPAES